jgi:hypothetical protein
VVAIERVSPTTQEFNLIELHRAMRSGRQDERYEIVHLFNEEIHAATMAGDDTKRLKKLLQVIKSRPFPDSVKKEEVK